MSTSRSVAASSLRRHQPINMLQSVNTQTAPSPRALDASNWGLDRVDQRTTARDNAFVTSTNGAGVFVYVVDSGINKTHVDLAGNPFAGWSTSQSCELRTNIGTMKGCYRFYSNYDGNDLTDCNGHGTHIAGIVGSSTYGVAPGATIVPVRVLDCTGAGDVADILDAIDWIVARQAARPAGPKPAIVTMSLGFSQAQYPEASTVMKTAVQDRLLANGIAVLAASGNGGSDLIGDDACDLMPAAIAGVGSVAAIGSNDVETSFTNYGNCVDIYAPGSSIMSTWIGSSTATYLRSGTSMATPFVAGALALFFESSPTASADEAWNAVLANATTCAVARADSTRPAQTPNRLVYVGATAGPPCAPSDVSAVLNGTSVTVNWSKPIEGSGALISSYTATATGGSIPLTCTSTQPTTSCTISGLSGGRSYVVSVTATSAGGTSGVGSTATVAVPASTFAAIQPISLSISTLKVKKSILLKSLVKSISNGKRTYKLVSGACRLTSTRLYAATSTGRCRLKVSIVRTKTQPAVTKTFTIRIIK